MDKFKSAQPVITPEKVVIESHPFRNFLSFIFKFTMLLVLVIVVASISLYGEYLYFRSTNTDLKVPGALGSIYAQIDEKLGFDWSKFMYR